jgi:haloalkane dehalogenase
MTSRPVRALNVATNMIPRLTSGAGGIGRHMGEDERKAFLGGFRSKRARHRFHDTMAAARRERPYLESVARSLVATPEIPLLTIFGEKNDPFGFQAQFRSYRDDVEEMVVPGGNHFPMTDDPDGVARRITRWQAELVQPGR